VTELKAAAEEAALDDGDEEGEGSGYSPDESGSPAMNLKTTSSTVARNRDAPADVLKMLLEEQSRECDEAEKESYTAIKELEALKCKIADLEACAKVHASIPSAPPSRSSARSSPRLREVRKRPSTMLPIRQLLVQRRQSHWS
jgi:hypothetical protein